MRKNKWKEYWKRTWKNKVVALSMLTLASSTLLIDRDGTGLVFTSMFALPLLFAKDNWLMS